MTTEPEIAVLYDEDAIAQRVDAIAAALAEADTDRLLVVAVLKGSFVFAADLIRAMHRAGIAPEMEFIHLSSYGTGTTSSGTIRVVRDIESDVAGRDVLLVDDILESGRTLAYARDLIMERGAKAVKVAALLDKPHHRVIDLHADYVGFDCPDKFVVGYGMDAAHAYRQLPFIGYIVGDK
ncbi:hypoxanthine phosphoribosyltransferase [Breoghania sp.]|uniref:hypoxanthine phosphoribosyltransferase n=1 Tax=Breoghania sp. TaxID=2065378 RepID=UPI0029CA3CB8|nr:hypoxanthine phosphoribosyltransferase [Breoghania sp.]